jgi:hypothetical protein
MSSVRVMRAMPGVLRCATISRLPGVLVMGMVTESRSVLVVWTQFWVLGVASFRRAYLLMAPMMLMISHVALSAFV